MEQGLLYERVYTQAKYIITCKNFLLESLCYFGGYNICTGVFRLRVNALTVEQKISLRKIFKFVFWREKLKKTLQRGIEPFFFFLKNIYLFKASAEKKLQI